MATTGRELAAARWDRLREFIRQRGAVRVEEICEQLGISPATARRDLAALESSGEIRRVHGGAVSTSSRLDEPLFDDKTALAAREKYAIAQAALARIQPGETVFLDGGSTVLELARLLRERTNVTVVTNSLRAAIELAGQGPALILIGGELRRRSQTVVGPLTRRILDDLHVDRAFMGTIGLTVAEGLTTTDASEAFTKELVMRRAGEVVLLADSSKVGKVSFAGAGAIDDIDVLIIDSRADAAFLRAVRKHKVHVIQIKE